MTDFTSYSQLREFCLDLPPGNHAASALVAKREAVLTKPPRSLGRLEDLSAWLAHWQGGSPPRLQRVEILVFAGNHGVTGQGVSAYPAEVTAQMVANFAAGGAAINQLARTAGAHLRVIPLALDQPTADFTKRAGDERGGVPRRGIDRLPGGLAGKRSHLRRRDGHRQHHRGCRHRGGFVRRRRRALGRPRHRRRR